MNIPAGFIFLFLILLHIMPATAQPMAGTVQQTSRSWDTIFFHESYRHSFGYIDSIPGLGKIFDPNISYTITQSGNSLLVRKEVEHFVDNGIRPVTDTSDWLRIHKDTPLHWIDQHATTITNEEFAPFIYSWKSEEGLTCYDEIRSSHPSIYNIVIIASGKEIRKSINSNHLKKHMHDERIVNLNYPYNASTTLYQLFQLLNKSTQRWDQQFTFSNKKISANTLPTQNNISSFSISESPDPLETDTIYFSLPLYKIYSHPHQPRNTFFIGISNAKDDIRKDIPLDVVREQATHGPVITNLNYPYNINTKLYQLYLMVEQRFKAWDLQYIFSNKGK